jgi:hypothetical protein
MDDFDFIKAFAGVDVLQVEAVGEVVGRVMAKIFVGMVDAGLSHDDAHLILRNGMIELFRSLRPSW